MGKCGAVELSEGSRVAVFAKSTLVLVILLAALMLAALPALDLSAQASAQRAALPDGVRATGVHSVDGGYGLAEPFYAELVAKLLDK